MKCHVPNRNPWRGQWLVGRECRVMVTERINTAEMLYQAEVAKRTGRLAGSPRVTVRRGGAKRNYLEGVLTVGGESARGMVDYIPPHEFGASDRFDANRGDPSFDETEGDRDLELVLDMLAWVPL